MYNLGGPILKASYDDDATFHLYEQAAALKKELGTGALVGLLVVET